MLRRIGLVLVAVSFALVAAACKQGVGDRCQVQSDCDDNLICVLPVSGNAQIGGTCEKSGGTDDGGVVDQVAPVDAQSDQ